MATLVDKILTDRVDTLDALVVVLDAEGSGEGTSVAVAGTVVAAALETVVC